MVELNSIDSQINENLLNKNITTDFQFSQYSYVFIF